MPATNEEQYLLELINDARLNPFGDAGRYLTSYSPLSSPFNDIQSAINYFNVSGPALQQAYAALQPVKPLAWNDNLANAARGHNQALIASDSQSHQAPGEADLGQRATSAGYNWSYLAENVFSYGDSLIQTHAAFMIDWGAGPNGMQSPPGHRDNIMNPNLREVGIGVTGETNPSTQVGPLVVTEDFGARFGAGGFVLGVAFTDADGDRFYDPGEGRGDLFVTLGSQGAASAPSGGYTLETAATGQQNVILSGAGLAGPVTLTLSLQSQGAVKVDVLNGDSVKVSASAVISGPVTNIEGLGVVGLNLVAAGSNHHGLIGTPGNDSLDGGSGTDFIAGGAGADFVRGLDGDDDIYGGDGNDDVNGNVGSDTVRGENGDDYVRGGMGNDKVYGGAGNDVHVNGNIGDDMVWGGTGNDTVYGGQNNDTLYGEDGNDWLSGDLGDDNLFGGAGADRFLFRPGAGVDWVGDFNSAEGDRIQLAPGTPYTITTYQGQAVVDLGGGATIGLAGVAPSQMGDWLVYA